MPPVHHHHHHCRTKHDDDDNGVTYGCCGCPQVVTGQCSILLTDHLWLAYVSKSIQFLSRLVTGLFVRVVYCLPYHHCRRCTQFAFHQCDSIRIWNDSHYQSLVDGHHCPHQYRRHCWPHLSGSSVCRCGCWCSSILVCTSSHLQWLESIKRFNGVCRLFAGKRIRNEVFWKVGVDLWDK